MILGCSTFVFEGRALDTALAEIAGAGFKVVELCSFSQPDRFQSYQVGQGQAYADDVRKKVRDRGLEVGAIAAYANPLEEEGRKFIVGALELAGEIEGDRIGAVAINDALEAVRDALDRRRPVGPLEAAVGLCQHGVEQAP